ncbi:hypothetical protein PtA15_5A912 [Puccinia triticina]|uniref:SprT-like domain-containing protein n=1 Tax=Puccinia triticina TaxID=208348 RepID=A0ABY7CMY1_9BASI|nr:uncharacterized protein PtA15_5A912 [Puccinia triticina]WAQ85337.1 hypothetical protein PtA15_5A912 [Puccinia triticina]
MAAAAKDEADRIAVAASRALQQISSAAHARSLTQPSNTTTTPTPPSPNPRQHPEQPPPSKDDILDIFMSPDKPKSRLRQLAENSAKKFSPRPSSLALQAENENSGAEHFVLNLGIPTKPIPTLADYKPPSRRSIGPRRSSIVSKRACSPTKSPKPPIEVLLDDLDILDRSRSTKSPFEPTTKKPLSKSKSTTRSTPNKKSPPSDPPATRRTRRSTISAITKDDHSSTQSRTRDNKTVDRGDGPVDDQSSEEESDCSSDSFDAKVLLVKAETEEEDSVIVNPVRPATRSRTATKPKRVISDSDEEDDDSRSLGSTSFSSSKSPRQSTTTIKPTAPRRSQRKSSLRASHSQQKSSAVGEIIDVDDDTESDDSIEIQPSRALQFQKLRSQALTTGSYSTSCDPLNEPIRTTNTIPSRNNRRVVISSDESSSGEEEEIQIRPTDNHLPKPAPKLIPASKPTTGDQSSSGEEEIQIRPKENRTHSSPRMTPVSRRRHVISSDPSSSDEERIQIKPKDNRPKASPKPVPASDGDKPKAKGAATKSRGGQSKKPAKPAPKAPSKPELASLPFVQVREEMAQDLLVELNKRVFGRQLPAIQLVWSKRLNTTAGRAHYMPQKDSLGNRVVFVKVELALKVVDDVHKLRNTLAHELCHVACWFIDKQLRENHGRFFKAWGRKVHQAFPDIVITTTHSYKIVYKFQWACNGPNCTRIYGRHSDSIKPARQRCMCGGGLVAILRNGKPVETPATPVAPTTPSSAGDSSIELLIDLDSPGPCSDDERRGAPPAGPSSRPSASSPAAAAVSREPNPYLSELEEIDPAHFLNPYLGELSLLDPTPFQPPNPAAPQQHPPADERLVDQLALLAVHPN